MRWSRVVRFFASLAIVVTAFAAQPAAARRTVFDTQGYLGVGSTYCSPNECNGFSTPFSVQIGGTSYNNFYANSNGTLSFGSIFSSLALETPSTPDPNFIGPPPVTDLSTYGVPIFSPNFLDGPGFDSPDTGLLGIFDGNFVAQTSIGANSFTTSWYPCITPQGCGLDTVDVVLSTPFDPNLALRPAYDNWVSFLMSYANVSSCPCTDQQLFASGQQNYVDLIRNIFPIYTMTLTNMSNGFQVDFSYNQGSTGQIGSYGYSLPTGSFQTAGPLSNQSFFFASVPAVPEPVTWMMMLLGFASIGIALRRKRIRRTIAV